MKTFMLLLDAQCPDWWIQYATQQELADCVRACTDGHSGTVEAKETLRKSVRNRIFPVAKVALEWEERH